MERRRNPLQFVTKGLAWRPAGVVIGLCSSLSQLYIKNLSLSVKTDSKYTILSKAEFRQIFASVRPVCIAPGCAVFIQV